MSDSKFVRFVAPSRAVLFAHIIATIALLVAAYAVVTTVLPFHDLGFTCGSPLSGAKVLHGVPLSSNLYNQGGPICRNTAHTHLVTAIVVFVLAITAGLGGWLLPLGLPWWWPGQTGGPGKKGRKD